MWIEARVRLNVVRIGRGELKTLRLPIPALIKDPSGLEYLPLAQTLSVSQVRLELFPVNSSF